MIMERIKWDESMAERCLARYQGGYPPITYYPKKVKSQKAAQVKTAPEKDFSIDIVAGEWDNFQYALSKELKKKHK